MDQSRKNPNVRAAQSQRAMETYFLKMAAGLIGAGDCYEQAIRKARKCREEAEYREGLAQDAAGNSIRLVLPKMPKESNKTPSPQFDNPFQGFSPETIQENARRLGRVLQGDQSHLDKPLDSSEKKKH